MLYKIKILLFFIFIPLPFFAQIVFQDVNKTAIYDFLDEMASLKIIDLNSATKPYSRILIAEKLQQIDTLRQELNPRQLKELDFYLQDFNKELLPNKSFKRRKDLFFYKNEDFAITINPILGIHYFTGDSGTMYHRWNGAEAFASYKKLAFYSSLRDNHESLRLAEDTFLINRPGANYKRKELAGDYSEMRGGITYGDKYFSIGLVKDYFVWGNNYNGANILSGHAPSFAQIFLKLKPVSWFELNYLHGWLVSEVIDSANSYWHNNNRREVFHSKFIAANMITISPFKQLKLSVGNSVVYSDKIQPAYLIPVMFFKSVDHSLNAVGKNSNFIGQNSQMFFDISCRMIPKTHIYTVVFMDELNIGNIWDKGKHTNFYSLKTGVSFYNLLPNTAIFGEFTRTNPVAYQHFLSTTTYTSNQYNMGHYLGNNTQEIYAAIQYKPVKNLLFKTSFTQAKKGRQYIYTGTDNDILGLPYLDSLVWQNEQINLSASYQVIHDGFIFMNLQILKNKGADRFFMPAYLRGNQTVISGGLNFGF